MGRPSRDLSISVFPAAAHQFRTVQMYFWRCFVRNFQDFYDINVELQGRKYKLSVV